MIILNGVPDEAIIKGAIKDLRDDFLWVLLCYLPSNTCTPWVTWQYNEYNTGCFNGWYVDSYTKAYNDFLERTCKFMEV